MISLRTKKEIRMLLPEWSMALVLASTPLTLLIIGSLMEPSRPYALVSFPLSLFALALGCTWLATAIFGKENNYGTAEQLFALPLSRKQVCLKKGGIGLLSVGSAVLFFLCCVWLGRYWSPSQGIRHYPIEFEAAAGIIFLCSFGPGLLFTSFFRNFHEAFWITFLSPFAIVLLGGAFATLAPDHFQAFGESILIGALVIYGLICTGLAWIALSRWQATGGANQNIVFSLPKILTSRNRTQNETSNPGLSRTLIVKEVRIHQLSFLITALFALIYAGFIYWFRNQPNKGIITDEFVVLLRMGWLIIPAAIGATAIAEERSLKVSDWHRTLPASQRHQWTVKLGVALILGYLLGAIVPFPLDRLFQSWSELLSSTTGAQPSAISLLSLNLTAWIGPILATLVGFFASSLTRSLLQALLTTAIISILLMMQLAYVAGGYGHSQWVHPQLLVGIVMMLTLTPLLLLGAYRNFHLPPSFRKACGLVIGFWLLTSVSTAAISRTITSRFWESWTPHPEQAFRAASPRVQGRIIRDEAGFTILNHEGRLFHLTRATADPVEKKLDLRSIGPDQKWQSIQFTRRNRFAIALDGSLWTWNRAFDFPKYSKLPAEPPHQIPSEVPWKQLVYQNREVNGAPQILLYGLKTDGSLHEAVISSTGTVGPFEPSRTDQHFNTLEIVGNDYKLAITREGKLILLGADIYNLFKPGPSVVGNFSRSGDPQTDNTITQLGHFGANPLDALPLNQSTDWKAIHIHHEAVLLPKSGYRPDLNQEDARLITNRRRFSIPVIEKNDGSFWTLAWIAKYVYGHEPNQPHDFALTSIPEASWRQQLSIGSSIFALWHGFGLRADHTLWEIKQNQIPLIPQYENYRQETRLQRLDQRSDWSTIESYHGTNTLLGLTENDILWTWGVPLFESPFYNSNPKEKIRILPPRRTPNPIFDLRTGQAL